MELTIEGTNKFKIVAKSEVEPLSSNVCYEGFEGDMLLVLERPGSGCSAGQTKGFNIGEKGNVNYKGESTRYSSFKL